jgi:hypothetical protein
MSTIIDLANRGGGVRPRRLGLGSFLATGVFVLILLVLFGPALFGNMRLHVAQYTGDYYAFYLSDGSVFYGQVRASGLGRITLANAYSFQKIDVGETSTSNLVALRDNPLTRPDNWMVIMRDHVLFYERIGDDASILQALTAQ